MARKPVAKARGSTPRRRTPDPAVKRQAASLTAMKQRVLAVQGILSTLESRVISLEKLVYGHGDAEEE